MESRFKRMLDSVGCPHYDTTSTSHDDRHPALVPQIYCKLMRVAGCGRGVIYTNDHLLRTHKDDQ